MSIQTLLPIKILLLLTLLGGTAFTLSAQLQPNPELQMPCKYFKNGKFEYTSPGRLGITVKRNGKKHIEFNSNTGEKAVFRVEWPKDTTCVYILTFKKSNRPSRLRKGWQVKVIITETFDDYYDFRSDRYGIRERGSLLKILTKAEKRKKEKEAQEKAAEELRLAREKAIQDSLKKAGVVPEKDKPVDPNAKNEQTGKEGKDNDKGKHEKGENGKEKDKGKDKKDKDSGKKDKAKKDKKEKPEKEKKEKKEKPPKEKKEKPPKEKKEKPPKEKKEKPPKDEEGGDEE
ncbi:MAG: hypothetical protein H6581_11095 [Bacteroidia bacterium]|nr:hypothetical protein [Bacteroidia bacterium]